MEQKILGNAIRSARIKNGLSQESLAELIGTTPTHLKHLESEHRKPSIEVLFKLCKTLHFSLDSIIFETDFRNTYKKEIVLLLNECNDNELRIIQDLIHSLLKNRAESNDL